VQLGKPEFADPLQAAFLSNMRAAPDGCTSAVPQATAQGAVRVSSVASNSSLPPGRRTRASSRSPGMASGRCSSTQPQTIASKQASRYGNRVSPAATCVSGCSASVYVLLQHLPGVVKAGDQGVGIRSDKRNLL